MVNKNKEFLLRKNSKGWIRIVEAFVAILLIAGALLILISKGYLREDISSQVYEQQVAILREIQLDKDLRTKILLNASLNTESGDPGFPQEIINKINSRKPDYLECKAKICELDKICGLRIYPDKDVYSQSVAISTDLQSYSPRQLKMFCWRV